MTGPTQGIAPLQQRTGLVVSWRTGGIAMALVLAPALALMPVPALADAPNAEPAAGAAVADALPAASPPLRVNHHPVMSHWTPAQRLEQQVRGLTHALNLSPPQQLQVRTILLERQRKVQALRSGDGLGASDATAATLAIQEQTRSAIRQVLNEDQQFKYGSVVPRAQLAPAQADLQHWLDLQAAQASTVSGRENPDRDAPDHEARYQEPSR